MDDVWIVIPARGGSVEIPRKNVKQLAGKPLIQYAIELATELVGGRQAVVITDSQEIANFATLFGVSVILEPHQSSPSETLDEKVLRNTGRIRQLGAKDDSLLITIQPTSPLVSLKSAVAAVELLNGGATSVVSVVPDFHLSWRWSAGTSQFVSEQLERKNRQDLEPRYIETGAIIGSRLGLIEEEKTRVVPPISPLVLTDEEAIDIDSFGDFFQAEQFLTRSRVLIVVDGGIELGLGHVYRALAIANELSRHEILVAVPAESTMALSFLSKSPYRLEALNAPEDLTLIAKSFQPDVVFFDILDTKIETVKAVRNSDSQPLIVTLEDEGPGAALCDVGIFDLTGAPQAHPSKVLSGPEFAVLGPSFELYRAKKSIPKVRNLLVTFGGTDPSKLTSKTLDALKRINYRGTVTVVTGPGSGFILPDDLGLDIEYLESVEDMAFLIASHDMGVGSRGRTVFEFAAMGVPMLCFAQNEKESRHIHVGVDTGSVAGGDGYLMSALEIATSLETFIRDEALKDKLIASSARFRKLRSNHYIIHDALKGSRLVGSVF